MPGLLQAPEDTSDRPSWLLPPPFEIKQEPLTALTSALNASLRTPPPPPTPARTPQYTDEHQSALDDARYTVQEARATAALVTKLGFLPATKKAHCRRNAARARCALSRLQGVREEAVRWREEGGGKMCAVTDAVEREADAWIAAVERCGVKDWDVDDGEWRRRAKVALGALEGAVARFGVGAPGVRVQGVGERVRGVVMRYVQVVHLVAMGWEGGGEAPVAERVAAVYEAMVGMTGLVDVELVVREQAVMVASVVARVSFMNT